MGTTGESLTVIVILRHTVLLQEFCHLAKYVVETTGEGSEKDVPFPADVPPHVPVNQSNVVPEPPEPPRIMLPPALEQKLLLFVESDNGATANCTTVIVKVMQLL